MKRDGHGGRDIYTLASGREFYAHSGIIGIDEDGSVFQGFDGDIEEADYAEHWREGLFTPRDKPPLTAEERREIAEEMVARWRKWGGLT